MSRAIWKGALSFGLVHIPVRLYATADSHDITFHLLHGADGGRIKLKRVCAIDGREVELKDVVKGYEVADGKHVVATNEELDALDPQATRMISIKDFVDPEGVDPLLYGRSYYLVPEATAVKAYALLMKAMQHSQRIAIARIVMRQREHLCAVRPVKGHIVISTLRYAEELVSLSELKFPAADGAPRKRELEMAEQLIASMSTTFHPRRYRDDYRQKVADLLRRKASGETLAPSPPSDEEELPRSLEEALAASLEEVQHRPAIDRSGSRQAPRHATAVAHRKTAFKDDGSSSPHH